MSFSEQELISNLPELGRANKFWVAYSGGLDSHVLLFAIHQLLNSRKQVNPEQEDSLSAIHINHGISESSLIWQRHCQSVCDELNIPLLIKSVRLDSHSGKSLEMVAREARYVVFNDLLDNDSFLLMGHHQDDQIETMLYRLMRGTGVRGLKGIAVQRDLQKGKLIRPLLAISQTQIEQYAKQQNLQWIEDESNQDTLFDRNYLRHTILPKLSQRWPNFAQNWQRTAQLCNDAEQLQQELGELDLDNVKTEHDNRLSIAKLKLLSDLRKRNLLRVWFDQLQTKYGMPVPNFAHLKEMLSQVLGAAEDANPLISWSNDDQKVEVRRYANQLVALKIANGGDDEWHSTWKVRSDFKLPFGYGYLKWVEVKSDGLNLSNIDNVQIRLRQGGEKLKGAGKNTRPLKKIFQDYKVPPWLRSQLPLIYYKGELIAVADLLISDKWQCQSAHKLYRICWEKSDIYCGY